MTQKISRYLPFLLLIILAIVFFFVYSTLSFNYLGKNIDHNLIFNSPDETANYYFAYTFANQSELHFFDPANKIVNDLVTPRSMKVINQSTVPASFIGFALIAGSLAKIFGNWIIFYVTPIFAILGVFFFYLLIKEIFNKRAAYISAILLIINPAWWYYAAKSLMPNVLFISLLIIGLYIFFQAVKSAKLWQYIIFGLVIGLALTARTSEITWLGPLILALVIIYRKRVRWLGIVFSFIACVLSFSPVFYFNFQNYHSIFSFGYAVDLDLAGKDKISQGLNIFEKIFLPFGFDPKTALINLYNYSYKIFPVWTIVSLISLLIFSLFAFIKKNRQLITFLIIFLTIGAYLTLYYGSWVFNDNPNPQAATIGNSYVRYWLPLYIFILPMIGYIIANYFRKSKIALVYVMLILFVSLGALSLNQVIYGQDEGIYYVQQNINYYEMLQNQVNQKIEKNAIIIADRMDKVFFPRHSVVFKLNCDYDYERVENLIKAGYPVYYFYFTRSDEELKKFSELFYQPHRLKVLASIADFKELSLYPIIQSN